MLWKRESDEDKLMTKGKIIGSVVVISLIAVCVFLCWATFIRPRRRVASHRVGGERVSGGGGGGGASGGGVVVARGGGVVTTGGGVATTNSGDAPIVGAHVSANSGGGCSGGCGGG